MRCEAREVGVLFGGSASQIRVVRDRLDQANSEQAAAEVERSSDLVEYLREPRAKKVTRAGVGKLRWPSRAMRHRQPSQWTHRASQLRDAIG